MNTATWLCSLALSFPSGQAPAPQVSGDLRVELPRDVRLVLFGVPSVTEATAAQERLREAIQEYEAAGAAEEPNEAKLEQSRRKICFRLGRFDQTVATLVTKLRDQQRFKGLEAYQQLANELQQRSESLGAFCGDSSEPVVVEEEATDEAMSQDAELAKQLKADLDRIDQTLRKIDDATRSDAERKAQLDREIGNLGQFALHLRSFVDQIKGGSAAGGPITIDTSEIVQGVQGLIDATRQRRLEREPREPRGGRDPNDQTRQRYRRRYLE